jgi:hypothetical protein
MIFTSLLGSINLYYLFVKQQEPIQALSRVFTDIVSNMLAEQTQVPLHVQYNGHFVRGVSTATGRSSVSSTQRPHWLGVLKTTLSNGNRSFSRIKRPCSEADHSLPSGTDVKIVELRLHAPISHSVMFRKKNCTNVIHFMLSRTNLFVY